MAFKFRLGLAVLTLASSILSASAASSDKRITIQQLKSPTINLHNLLYDSHGILRISLDNSDGDGFANLRKNALRSLCDCPTFSSSNDFMDALQSHPKDLQQIHLPDGTIRRTLASATVGFDNGEEAASVLELPSWVQDTCGQNAYESFEDLRDAVADVVGVFMDRLDIEKGAGEKSKGEIDQKSYRNILSSANHLEHFHVYTKKSADPSSQDEGAGGSLEEETSTLDYHTDAGFFLSFVPAMNCNSYTTDNNSFYLKGRDEPMHFGDDEVVIMMGAGAQYWLPSEGQSPFLAASHALRLSADTHRSWYGKMHLLPASFTAKNVSPQLSSTPGPVKYGDVLPTLKLEGNKAHVPEAPVDGCGTTAFNENSLPMLSLDATTVRKQSRRRLQHVNSPENCNNQTNFFCWHQCIDIPEAEHAEAYVNDGYSLYCLDPAILVDTHSVAEATDPCAGGFVHNSKCKGTWHETDKDIPGYKLPYEVKKDEDRNYSGHDHSEHAESSYPLPSLEDQYCYGGTSMYMDGFTWQGSTCVIYLFQSWVLSTPGKFALAAIGSIIFGIALEFVLYKRRTVYSMKPGTHRLILSALVYGIQLSMGYFIMLVIMTYSGPLFISTVGGMMIGHMLFNAQDAVAKRKIKMASEEVAPLEEVNEQQVRRHTGSNTELSSYQNGGNVEIENCCGSQRSDDSPANESTQLRESMNDGVTPCCQYTV